MLNYTAITVIQGSRSPSSSSFAFELFPGRTVPLTYKERKMTKAAAKQSVLKSLKKCGFNINGVKLEFVTTLDRLPNRN